MERLCITYEKIKGLEDEQNCETLGESPMLKIYISAFPVKDYLQILGESVSL